MKEWGVELVQDEIINPKGEEKVSVYIIKKVFEKFNR